MTRRDSFAWCGLLVALFAAYWPALHGGMVWDDAAHLTRPGLRSWQGLCSIWTEPRATQQYYPLTHSAFWIMHRLWGDDTLGYHLTNVVLHGLNGGLLLVILRRLQVPGAIFATGLFLLHPVQVESVAWMTELKNTLSGFFCLAATLVYLRFDQSLPQTRWIRSEKRSTEESQSIARIGSLYIAAFLLFALGLLSKTAVATWPAAMLVVCWWRHGRIQWKQHVLPLLPFFAVALLMGWLTAYWEVNVWGAQGQRFDLWPGERIIIAGRAIWFYLGSLLWPVNFMFFYPRWSIDSADWAQYLFPMAALVVLACAWALRKVVGRGPLAALLLYGGTLLPCLGFFNLYWHLYTFVCDHMQYLACIGIFALIGASACLLKQHLGEVSAPYILSLKVAILITLVILTRPRAAVFVDSETLWKDTIARNPRCWMACNNLGIEYQQAGRFEESLRLLRRAVEIMPTHASAWTNIGLTCISLGDLDQAMDALDKAIQIDPNVAESHFHRGRIMAIRNQYEAAIQSYHEAIRLKPAFAAAHAYFGLAQASTGQPVKAISAYETALRYQPDQVDALNNLAWLLATTPVEVLQNGPRAMSLASRAVEVAGSNVPELLGTLGAAQARCGLFEQAARTTQKAADLAESQHHSGLAASLRQRLKQYKSGQAHSEAPPVTRP